MTSCRDPHRNKMKPFEPIGLHRNYGGFSLSLQTLTFGTHPEHSKAKPAVTSEENSQDDNDISTKSGCLDVGKMA